jgi:hypothetical protein
MVPLKGVSFTKDAALANECVISQEHADIVCQNAINRRAEINDTTVSIGIDCIHHQAALVKKPAVLAMDGLASTLVRMCHVHQQHSFSCRFEKALDHYADHVLQWVQGSIDHRVSSKSHVQQVRLVSGVFVAASRTCPSSVELRAQTYTQDALGSYSHHSCIIACWRFRVGSAQLQSYEELCSGH